MVKENIKYGLYSFRYFFSFPDDDIYGLASVFQFMLGKMYDLVVFGSVANCIIKASKPRIHKKQTKGEEK